MAVLDFFRRKLSADDFAAMVVTRARQTAHPDSVRYDAEEFRIHFGFADRVAHTMYLHNAYRDAQAVPASKRGEVIDGYLRSVIEAPTPDDPEESPGHLMPVVRDSAMFGWVRLTARLAGDADGDKHPAMRPFAEGLSIALVLDSEHDTRTVTPQTLASWGLDDDAALHRALANLRERTEDAGMRPLGDGVFISTWHDIYDASRILLTDMIHRLPVRGEPVAIIPSRNHLLVTGSMDDAGLMVIGALAADVLEKDSRPLSPQLLVLREGRWEPFSASLPDDLARRLSLARYQRLIATHDDQKKLLDQIHEKEGVDLFVATYKAFDTGTAEGIVGTTQWTRDVATLLPRSDRLVLFCSRRNELVFVPWNDAVPLIPGLAAPVGGLDPPRYLVVDFPNDATYDRLKTRAVQVTPLGSA